MKDVYSYITPIKVPDILAGKKVGEIFIPITFGVPTIYQFAAGVEAFARDRGIDLKAQWTMNFPTVDNAIEYIVEGLENNSPIALLIYSNTKLSKILATDSNGNTNEQNFNNHWVTITAINGADGDNPTIKVSSWGGTATLNLNDVIRSFGFGGMLYFK